MNWLSGSGLMTSSPSSLPALERYNFSHPNRGRCIIINQRNFHKALTGQNDREGTDVDAEACESAFLSLGFDVTRHDNLNQTELSMTMSQASKEDHSKNDCFVCVILSHGEDGVIYATNGTTKIESLVSRFKGNDCPSLAGKPKLFFIQACRGRRFDFGAELPDKSVDELDAVIDDSPKVIRIPTEADFLMAYSVVPGHFSWRNNVDGSWFIQALVRVIREHGDKMEIMSMMTLVNRIVAYDFESCTDDDFTSNMKQVPSIVSMLTKQVFFEPKY
ncbi:hypothetical protein CAPTEDRAFT_224953 [Capitella teleta]|uniref:Caspase family p20 domain-containing protein n=1 Tax=Capitella teleta TaxID=283909 RepID=R7THM2_CAPTE|nr:hypothetical protein CAPTEDRAFT_224953 [Capitella teleta]|eukprot:ELT92962.1 hypothetical protein CAPTEDRAFT_224953 [Capitella teleta]